MPGLPFVNLSNYDDPAMPTDDTVIRYEGRTRTADQIRREHEQFLEELKGPGPRRSWIEPNWEAPTATPAQPATSENPLDILITQNKLALDTALANITAQRAALQKSVEPDLALLHQKAQLDIQALQNESGSGLTGDDFRAFQRKQEQHLKDMALAYQKKELDIQAKVRPDLDALDAAEQKARSGTALKVALAQHDIALYQGMMDRGELNPATGKSKQFAAAGKNIPAEAFKPPKEQTALQQYQQYYPILDNLAKERNNYRRGPKGGWQVYDDGVWANAPAEQWPEIELLDSQVTELKPMVRAMYEQAVGRIRPNLGIAADDAKNPIAASVAAARPKRSLRARLTTGIAGALGGPVGTVLASSLSAPRETIPRVQSDVDYTRLSSGTEFIDPTGQRRRKP